MSEEIARRPTACVTDTWVAVTDRPSTVEVLMPAIQQVSLVLLNFEGPLALFENTILMT